MWQGVWQELLDNQTVYKAAGDFLSSLELDVCDLPWRQVFGQFCQEPPLKSSGEPGHDNPSSSPKSPEPTPAEEAMSCGEETGEETRVELVEKTTETTNEGRPLVKTDAWPKSTKVFRHAARYDTGALSFLSGEEGGFLWTSKSAAPASVQGF